MNERSIFNSALEKEDAASRAAYLDSACAGDAELRKRVEVLLHAHAQAGGLLDQPAPPGLTELYRPIAESVGTLIGPYKLLQKLGEGGMGVVYLAEQEKPVRRMVALKIIKPGMDTGQVIARFESERQALALMDHPNIAKVLDAGATDTARPFFVMELVKGIPITNYCDQEHLTPRERLELFLPICHAVQHAHQKGIIHRDLKPSNALIALYDGNPVPKVIDFGVSKATSQKLTERTMFTEVGSIVGTLEYMAPEQAELNNLDVDTRADIYSLGVMLYEILAGSPPFSSQHLRSAGLGEMLRMIKEVEPPKPSTRLSTSQELPGIAAKRKLEPKRLTKQVSGELDWIVMKCLEKERGRRYDTANGLAQDLNRYLTDEPVQAGPPSRLYRARKFARKNRVALGTVTAFVMLLLASVAVSYWLAAQAWRAENIAEKRQREAEESAEAAEQISQKLAATLWVLDEERQEAEMSAARLQVDLDLAETDPRAGLLRLVRTLKSLPADEAERKIGDDVLEMTRTTPESQRIAQRTLREFITAAVLAGGQAHTTLLSPITHNGHEIISHEVSLNNLTLLTLGADGTARLCETWTGQPIATLQQGVECVVKCGFSPDGRTVFTIDETSVARFWDVPRGRYRSQTEPRPDRYQILGDPDENAAAFTRAREWCQRDSSTCVAGGNRLLTRRVVVEVEDSGFSHSPKGPVELWDVDTGALVTRLDGPNTSVDRFRFVGDGQWIITLEEQNPSNVLVFSARDGQLAGRLEHTVGTFVSATAANPSGRRIATTVETAKNIGLLQFWNTQSWLAEPVKSAIDPFYVGELKFWTDDLIGISTTFDMSTGQSVYRTGRSEPVARLFMSSVCTPLLPDANLVQIDQGEIYDTNNWARLVPPSGHKFHPSLARFAPDGRFVMGGGMLFDTVADKQIVLRNFSDRWWESGKHVQGMGMVGVVKNHAFGVEVRHLPDAQHLDIPADLLERWAQVCVCGELRLEGRFFKWDEHTWEKMRQKLATTIAPPPSLSFPGYVATDRLHWLRAEYEPAGTNIEKLRIAKQLILLAEFYGNKVEAIRWRTKQTELEKYLAPPPKED